MTKAIPFLTAVVAVTLGTGLGAIAGYYGGWVDTLIMRVTDALLSIPVMFFVIVLTGTAADVPIRDLLVNVAVVLGIPLAAAVGTRLAAAQVGASERLDALLDRSGPVGLALLAVAVVAIFAAHAQLVIDEPEALLRLLVPLLVFFAVAYLIANAVATRLRLALTARPLGRLLRLPSL